MPLGWVDWNGLERGIRMSEKQGMGGDERLRGDLG